MISLGEREKKFFVNYVKHPDYSFNKLAKNSDISHTTAKSYYDKFLDNGLIGSQKIITDDVLNIRVKDSVSSILNIEKLGLISIFVIFKHSETENKIQQVIQTLKSHPYFNKYIGLHFPENTVVFQFNIPEGLINKFMELIVILILQWNILELSVLELQLLRDKNFDFTRYDFENQKWNYWNEDDPYNNFDKFLEQKLKSSINTQTSSDILKSLDKENTPQLDVTDLYLLREIQLNYRISLKFLSDNYDIEISNISKKLKKIRKNYIKRTEAKINLSKFNFVKYIILGKFDTETFKNIIICIEKCQLPFAYKISKINNKTGLFIFFGPQDKIEIIYQLIKSISEKSMKIWTNDEEEEFVNPEMYDNEENTWIIDDRSLNNFYINLIPPGSPHTKVVEKLNKSKTREIIKFLEHIFFEELKLNENRLSLKKKIDKRDYLFIPFLYDIIDLLVYPELLRLECTLVKYYNKTTEITTTEKTVINILRDFIKLQVRRGEFTYVSIN